MFNFIMVFFLIGSAIAQKGNVVPESAVPVAVVNAFKAAHPETTAIWRKNAKKDVFAAVFDAEAGMRKRASYSADGKQLRAVDIGKESLLPANIVSDIKSKATGAEIKRAEKHTLLQKDNAIRYYAKAVNKSTQTRYHFRYDASGKMLDMKTVVKGEKGGEDTLEEDDDVQDVGDE